MGKTPVVPRSASSCWLAGTPYDWATWQPLNGLIDAVRISKAARYGKDFKPAPRLEPDQDTLVLYDFHEGQGDLLHDRSGNANHGKIVGAKWVKADATPVAPDTKSAMQTGPVQIPEPPPLAEWLKGRTVLTVSQDGKGQFKTIQAALNALKKGQVVKVLDRGPYREMLLLENPPEDVGLISECQTMVVLPEWKTAQISKPYVYTRGFSLVRAKGFRLSGLAYSFSFDRATEPKGAAPAAVLAFSPQALVVEECAFFCKSDDDGVMALLTSGPGSEVTEPLVVRDCLFQASRLQVLMWAGVPAPPVLVERNLFRERGSRIVISSHRQQVIRYNILAGPAPVAGIHIASHDKGESLDALEIYNNTVPTSCINEIKVQGARTRLIIRNNILPAFAYEGPGESDLPATITGGEWHVDHNAYVFAPESGLNRTKLIFNRSADLPDPPTFLSKQPANANYLRIPANSTLATGGAGGDWPRYIGALTPGPASSYGDWFSQLRMRWRITR
jgi:hypothetical protein